MNYAAYHREVREHQRDFREKMTAMISAGDPYATEILHRNDQFWIAILENELEEVRLRASSHPPAESFATRAEQAAWKSVERATGRRLQRGLDSRLRSLKRTWENACLPAETVLLLKYPKRKNVRYSSYPFLRIPEMHFGILAFEIRQEIGKEKAIAKHMAIWRSMARRNSASDFENSPHAAVAEVKGSTAASPAGIETCEDAVTLAEEVNEIGAIATATGALLEGPEPGGEASSAREPEEMGSSEEVMAAAFPLDMEMGELSLLEDPAGAGNGGEDWSSNNKNERSNDGGGHSSSSNSSSSSSSDDDSSDDTFVTWDEARKYPFDRGKRCPRSTETVGNA